MVEQKGGGSWGALSSSREASRGINDEINSEVARFFARMQDDRQPWHHAADVRTSNANNGFYVDSNQNNIRPRISEDVGRIDGESREFHRHAQHDKEAPALAHKNEVGQDNDDATKDTTIEQTRLEPSKTVSFAPEKRCHSTSSSNENEAEDFCARLHAPFMWRSKEHHRVGRVGSKQWQTLRGIIEEADANGKLKDAVAKKGGQSSCTFLHAVCMNDPPVDIVITLLDKCPGVANEMNNEGMLPLHVACSYGASEDVMRVLVEKYPQGIAVQDENFGRVPLHYIFYKSILAQASYYLKDFANKNNVLALPSREAVEIVTSAELVTLKDRIGLSPLHLLAMACAKIAPGDKSSHSDAVDILQVLLDCKPKNLSDFSSTSLQSFPNWLLIEALSHGHLRRILNQKGADPFFCSTMLMDVLIQATVICTYTIGVLRSNGELYLSPTGTALLSGFHFASTAYVTVRAVLKFIGFVRIGKVQVWARSGWNWFNLSTVVLLIVTSSTGRVRPEQAMQRLGLVAITGGMVWTELLAALRPVNLAFAVFLTGALHILVSLVPFLVTTIVLLGAFAFMYYALSYQACLGYLGDNDGVWNAQDMRPCTLKGSFLHVYATFVGGGMDDDDFTTSKATMFLAIVFSFLMVVLQLNVLIAVVTDSYGEVKKDGEKVFWRNRFYYLADLDAVKKMFGWGCLVQVGEMYDSTSQGWRESWNDMTWKAFGHFNQNSLLERNFRVVGRRWLQKLCLFLILGVWVLAGLITLGWLWPPQVRQWLMCPSDRQMEENGADTNQDIDEDGAKDEHENEVDAASYKQEVFDEVRGGVDSRFDELDRKLDLLLSMKSSGNTSTEGQSKS